MADWMDQLKEDIERERQEKAKTEANRQKTLDQSGRLINQAFTYTEEVLETEVHRLNQTMYQGERRAELRYTNNTLTGDHFILQIHPFRYMVTMDISRHIIEARAEVYHGERWVLASGFAPEITVTTDGERLLVAKAGKEHLEAMNTNLQEIPRILLSDLARAAS